MRMGFSKSSFFVSSVLISSFLFSSQLPALAEEAGNSSLNWTEPPAGEALSTGSPRLVLKNANSLLVLDPKGMIDPGPGSPFGLFENDTRFLSSWQLKVDGTAPTVIKAYTQQGYKGSFLYSIGDNVLIQREIVLLDGLSERIKISNFVDKPLNLKLSIALDCDFNDMFEVRGIKRKVAGGKHLGSSLLSDGAKEPVWKYAYRGLDGIELDTLISASKGAKFIASKKIEYDLALSPRSSQILEFRVDTSNTPESMQAKTSFVQAELSADKRYADWKSKTPEFKIDWTLLNDMIAQSSLDLYLLQQSTPKGPCLAAGLPFYACAFGRDQCITALQTLPFMPDLSRDILKLLAAYQGKSSNSFTEEEPGRIMHELRLGEMARCKEIAFIPYYGTVDATPLFLLLLSRYVEASGDLELAKSLWPNAQAALGYIERCTAETCFLYYGGKGAVALSNQAWKDSGDSIMHKDGKLATAPIAVCEVQGYLYDAYEGMAKLARKLGNETEAKTLSQKALVLKQKFKDAYWMPDERFVALALDGTKSPCDVITSNPGHLLSTGILDDEMADAVASRLMKDDMYSGWGLRTLSNKELRYNPISYHDGSVWPHDNAMIVEGLAARGRMKEASIIMESLIASAKSAGDARLPELFCGFPRNEFPSPVPYSVSCVPQAWAAGAVFQMLKAVLGINMVDGKIRIAHPRLPESINTVTVSGLRSAGASVSVSFKRNPTTGAVSVYSDSDKVEIDP